MVDFQAGSDEILVKVNGAEGNFEACRAWCGMRASFARVYIKVTAGCTATERQAKHDASRQAQEVKRYRRVVDELQRLQLECGQYFELIERDTIHNDTASALHHLDKGRECLRELGGTLASSADNEAALKEDFYGEPMEFQAYLPTARTTWQLQRICSRKHPKMP